MNSKKTLISVLFIVFTLFLVTLTYSFTVGSQSELETAVLKLNAEQQTNSNSYFETIQQCSDITVIETQPVIGTCSIPRTICVNESGGESCQSYDEEISDCTLSFEKVPVTKNSCITTGYIINQDTKITTTDYICSIISNDLVCDSKYDGNGDGICQSGETCLKYVIIDNSVSVLQKNSEETFTEKSESFFLESAKVEDIK